MAKMMLKKKRLGFPALARPQAIGDGEPAYGARLIIDPEDNDVKVIEREIINVAKAKWKDDWENVLAVLREEKRIAFEKTPYRNKKTGKVYDGFEGKYSLGTRNPKQRPTAVDRYGAEITDPAQIERILYSGCYVHAQVEFWAQDNAFGRRINCSLLGAMFAADGDSFGGGSAPASADEFAEYAQSPEESLDKATSGREAEDYV